mmetsp:Transcript_34926/g.76344  ORF Transcript_34926/g.76344 Transcript_34926/m.76344 type:complete len:235 (-) Transcript_34926:134-838(-)
MRAQATRAAPVAPAGAYPPLPAAWAAQVEAALGPGVPGEVLFGCQYTNIDLTRDHMDCLNGLNWLNDEFINVTMGLLQQRELHRNPDHPRVHYFSTFFYQALYTDKKEYRFENVQRWTGNLPYALHDCDKIVVPIHLGMHWVLAVCDLKNKQLRYLDSMGGYEVDALRHIGRYIQDESGKHGGPEVDTSAWERSHDPRELQVPQQQNGSDCGVFMLTFAEFEVRRPARRAGARA